MALFGYSQIVNGDFQSYSCSWSSSQGLNAVTDGCLGPQWKSFHYGNYMDGPSVYLASGNYFVELDAYTASGVNFAGMYYTGITFVPQKEYTLTFRCKRGDSDPTLFAKLSNNLPSTDVYNAGPQVYEAFHLEVLNTSWQTYTMKFIPDKSYTQLVFYCRYIPDWAPHDYESENLFLDDIAITEARVGDMCCTDVQKTYTTQIGMSDQTVCTDYIRAYGNVSVNAVQNTLFQAGKKVLLEPGVTITSSFEARIASCANTAPTANAGSDIYVCSSGGAFCNTLGFGAMNGVAYRWSSDIDGALSIMANSEVANPQICSDAVSDDYKDIVIPFKVRAINGCGIGSDLVNYKFITSCRTENEMDDPEEMTQTLVYPNPIVNGNMVLTHSVGTYTLYDALGRPTLYGKNTDVIDVRGLSTGVYTLVADGIDQKVVIK